MSVEGFNYDSIFMRLLNRVGDLFILSLIFTLFCVPVVTIGPSITALYYTAMKGITVGEGYVWKYFIKSFKQNFKQSLIMWLGFMFAFCILGVDVWFWFNQLKTDSNFVLKLLAVISVIMLAVVIMIFTYAFPLQAKFDNKISIQLRNAFLLSIKYFPTTLIVVIIYAAIGWIYYIQPALALVGFPMIGFGGVSYLLAFLMLRCFKPYLVDEDTDEKDADEWHMPDITDSTVSNTDGNDNNTDTNDNNADANDDNTDTNDDNADANDDNADTDNNDNNDED